MAVVIAGAGLGLHGSACLEIPAYICTGDTQCLAEGVPGSCDFTSGICIYPNTNCDTKYSDAKGNCMPPANQGGGSGGDGSGGDGGDTAGDDGIDDGADGFTDGIDDGMDDTPADTSDGGMTDDGMPDTSDTNAGPCDGGSLGNITDQGVPSASTVFEDNPDYGPDMAVDGDLTTSWFSSGPEGPGIPSVFDWTATEEHCINTVVFNGNAQHSNSAFHMGYGFEHLEVVVYDLGGEEVERMEADITGTPDPLRMIDMGGIYGARVSLELSQHEAPDCGGFSELQVIGV